MESSLSDDDDDDLSVMKSSSSVDESLTDASSTFSDAFVDIDGMTRETGAAFVAGFNVPTAR